MHLKIRRQDGVESLTTLEAGEIKVPIDGCIRVPQRYKHSTLLTSGYIATDFCMPRFTVTIIRHNTFLITS